jgi:putative mycofactocin binding protein MftB
MPGATVAPFDAASRWCVHPKVSLRDEEFGALAYHHDTRRLVFLKSPRLVELVRRLGEFDSAGEAVTALVDAGERARYLAALSKLARSEIVRGC